MPKSLAEMRAQAGPAPLPRATRTVTFIEGQHLLDRSRRLNEELIDVFAQAQRDAERKGAQPELDAEAAESLARTRKAGQRPPAEPEPPARAQEIRAEQAALVDELAEFQVELGLVGLEGGDWQQFKDRNPPRKDNEADALLTNGVCDSSALFVSLGQFVETYEGDELLDGDWDGWLAKRVMYADRRDLITDVVEMHEGSVDRAPKSRSSSPETQTSETS